MRADGPDTAGLPSLPVPPGGQVLAVGMDLVDVPALAAQLAQPGTVLAERAFTPRERREARRRSQESGSQEAEHLAARWAAKEAFVKAWSQAVNTLAGTGVAPALSPQELDWREIEVVSDHWHRPGLRLAGRVAQAVSATLGHGGTASARWLVSLTHDGGWAAAVVLALASGPEKET
ncbi:holo-ACP synthase [Actinomyces urogenitalis]|uniref:holo-ACP synthase AcpS n=1 Tax=Actinomyces urogenitalis TaxID=103621 RepID=UPI00242BA4D0|nr:holo-ACP synthase [Actinomyces urogenitalis]MCI7457627.1 holo-ACP synthase [Actinomyces urogenitalis]